MITLNLDTADMLEQLQEVRKPIDWEQRRFEIAKEILSYSAPKYWHDIYLTGADKAASLAIEYADALIAELKRKKS